MISFESKGEWTKTFLFLKKASNLKIRHILERYAKQGADALRANTPVRTGKTAASWSYEVIQEGENWIIYWKNSNTNKGINIAFIIQAGHGTGTGGYVQGIDYINPALAPVFQSIADEAFREVTSA